MEDAPSGGPRRRRDGSLAYLFVVFLGGFENSLGRGLGHLYGLGDQCSSKALKNKILGIFSFQRCARMRVEMWASILSTQQRVAVCHVVM